MEVDGVKMLGMHAAQVLATLSQMELDAEVRERVKTAVSNFVAHDMFTE